MVCFRLFVFEELRIAKGKINWPLSIRMWTSPMMQLDLSRRRVAAISFLSNISVTELTDEQKSEQNNLHCLQVSTIYFYVIQKSFQTSLNSKQLFMYLHEALSIIFKTVDTYIHIFISISNQWLQSKFSFSEYQSVVWLQSKACVEFRGSSTKEN